MVIGSPHPEDRTAIEGPSSTPPVALSKKSVENITEAAVGAAVGPALKESSAIAAQLEQAVSHPHPLEEDFEQLVRDLTLSPEQQEVELNEILRDLENQSRDLGKLSADIGVNDEIEQLLAASPEEAELNEILRGLEDQSRDLGNLSASIAIKEEKEMGLYQEPELDAPVRLESAVHQAAQGAGVAPPERKLPHLPSVKEAVNELTSIALRLDKNPKFKCVVGAQGALVAIKRGLIGWRTGHSLSSLRTMTRLTLLIQTVIKEGSYEEKMAAYNALNTLQKSSWCQALARYAPKQYRLLARQSFALNEAIGDAPTSPLGFSPQAVVEPQKELRDPEITLRTGQLKSAVASLDKDHTLVVEGGKIVCHGGSPDVDTGVVASQLRSLCAYVSEKGSVEEKATLSATLHKLLHTKWGRENGPLVQELTVQMDGEGVYADWSIEQVQAQKDHYQQLAAKETGSKQRYFAREVAVLQKVIQSKREGIATSVAKKLGERPSPAQVVAAMVDPRYSLDERIYLQDALVSVVDAEAAAKTLKAVLENPEVTDAQVALTRGVLKELFARAKESEWPVVREAIQAFNARANPPLTAKTLLDEIVNSSGLEIPSLASHRQLQRAAMLFERIQGKEEAQKQLQALLPVANEPQKERLAAFLEYASKECQKTAIDQGVFPHISIKVSAHPLQTQVIVDAKGKERESALHKTAEDLRVLFAHTATTSAEFAGGRWEKVSVNSPNHAQRVHVFNAIGYAFVQPTILDAQDLEQARERITFFLDLAALCCEQGNFPAAQGILAGLSATAVYRLMTPQMQENLKSQEALFASKDTYKAIRQEMVEQEQKHPIIPAFAHSLTDLTNATVIPSMKEEGGVNLSKIKTFSSIGQAQELAVAQGYVASGELQLDIGSVIFAHDRKKEEEINDRFYEDSTKRFPKDMLERLA